jgi:hypothetical protein
MMPIVLRRALRLGAVLVALCLWPSAGCTAGQTGLTLRQTEPKEDVWTIRCLTLEGPNRFVTAKNFEQALKKVKGLDPKLVQVFHREDSSAIYYGRYKRRYDAAARKESFRPDPLKDLNLIRQLSLTVEDRPVWPFALAVLDTSPTVPSGNPAWDLNNVKGYWSLQIGVFYNEGEMRERRRAAEEYCKILRERGEAAYYHHGAVNSSVCVGVFPKEAIVEFQREDPLTGVVSSTSKIVDPRMLALQKKYPVNLHNGHKVYEIIHDRDTGQKERFAHPSFPVKLPRADMLPTPPSGG